MGCGYCPKRFLIGYGLGGLAAGLGFYSASTVWALCLFPVGLRYAPSIPHTVGIAITFNLVAGIGLLPGIHALSNDLITALSAWVIPALLLSVPFALVRTMPWTGVMAALALMTLPPLGIIGLPSPLIVAGAILPGAGFAGLALILVLFQLLYSLSVPKQAGAGLMLALIGISLCGGIGGADSTVSHQDPRFTGIDMRLNKSLSADPDYIADYHSQSRIPAILNNTKPSAPIPLFPEAMAGRLTGTAQARLRSFARAANRDFIAGGEEFTDSGQYNNILAHVSAGNIDILYRQRMPAPWFMWRGGMDGFFKADLTRPGTFVFDDINVGALICYEIALPLLIFQTHWNEPDMVLVASNLWWGSETRLPDVVRLHIAAWSRLFGVPYISAMNV